MKRDKDQSGIKTNFRQANVLVIEDNNDHWVIIKQAMQAGLPEVRPVWASTPQQAISLLEACHNQEWDLPQLIFQDLYLPERRDGWALLRHIKAMPAPYNQIPIVMLSSSVTNADITEAYQFGISSYLVKPTGFEEWIAYFQDLRTYWWETVTLPPLQYRFW